MVSDTVPDESRGAPDQPDGVNDVVTQDPLPTLRPILQLGWKLVKWPLAFVLVNLGALFALLFTGSEARYRSDTEEDLLALWQWQSFFVILLAAVDAAVLAYAASWLSPQIRKLQGHTESSPPQATDQSEAENGNAVSTGEESTQTVISPHARSAHSLDIYLIKRNLRKRQRSSREGARDNTLAPVSSRGIVVNLLAVLATFFILVATASLTIFLGTLVVSPSSAKMDGSDSTSSPEKQSYSSSDDFSAVLPDELHYWSKLRSYGYNGPDGIGEWAGMVDGTWFLTDTYDRSLIHVVGFEATKLNQYYGPLLRMDQATLQIEDGETKELPLNVSSISWFHIEGQQLIMNCYTPNTAQGNSTSGTPIERYNFDLAQYLSDFRVALDKNETLWLIGESFYGFITWDFLYNINMTNESATLVASYSDKSYYPSSSGWEVPRSFDGYGNVFFIGFSILSAAAGTLLLKKTCASGTALVVIALDLLVQSASRGGAAFFSNILSFVFLVLLLWGKEVGSYLRREHQSWGLYGLLSFAYIDFGTDWRFSFFYFLSFGISVVLAQFVLNHPVLPLLACLSAVGAVIFFVFGIIYPPLLLVGLYAAILSAGMFVVDRQWIRSRPYAIYYLHQCFRCCRGMFSSGVSSITEATTPSARVAD